MPLLEMDGDTTGRFRRWIKSDGDVILNCSERVLSCDSARQALKRIKEQVPDSEVLDMGYAPLAVHENRRGEWRRRLYHRNGNIPADRGGGYSSRSAALDGPERVKGNAPVAEVEE